MPNIAGLLNDQIRRLARREIHIETRITRRAASRHRRDIAALKRQINDLLRRIGLLEQQSKRVTKTAPAALPEGVRYSPRTVRAMRAKLDLSALKFGKLVGVSGLTVYNWESGKSRPRSAQLAKLVALRGIGKREAMARLGEQE